MNRPQRVLVTGPTGQLGGALVRALTDAGADVQAVSRSACNLTDWTSVKNLVAAFEPDAILHCAAQTDVDGCERDPDEAYATNALATRWLAAAGDLADAHFYFVSTNFVFDGSLDRPYHEFDAPAPISVYGASKLAGEIEAGHCRRRTIIRTAMVFNDTGRNFVNTMKSLMSQRDRLTVVADQTGNPTYAPDLAAGIVQLWQQGVPGTVHMTNQGVAGWYEWAVAVRDLCGFDTTLEPIPASEYTRLATPPANGVMTSMVLPTLGIALPNWRDALSRMLAT